jgi:hypothetical protein
MKAQHETDQNTSVLEGGYFSVQYRSDYTITITDSAALHILHSTSQVSEGQTTVTNGSGLLSEVRDEASLGTLSFDNFRHIDLMNPDAGISVTDLTGLWIDKQTVGTNNYGIVLNGDGAIGDYGAAVVFGANQNSRIYGKSDGLYVYDGTTQTKISPHDPETGEWIFYSKNVKTGRVVKINMEKLVKAVEKLTGETFMIETMMEDE